MLFNSYAFIFVFLPIVLLGFDLVGRLESRKAVLAWLIACSVAFYGLWNPVSLAIIAPSVAINYLLGRGIRSQMARGEAGARATSLVLGAGIVFNICFLGYFKYKNFFLDSVNEVFGSRFPLAATILPLGISFITFQKIAFLVDVRAGKIERFDAFDFLVFVFFFPQLIAGPIVHYREMMPQFGVIAKRIESSHLAVGLCLFAIGLFKKAVLADGIAPHAGTVFSVAEAGRSIGFVNGWLGALAYTLQIYFDFSGYSDMAIGLARMFGIRLPANFNSPFKATNIVDFWGRWHMTLTRFLTAYVYTPIVMRLTRARMAAGKPILTRKSRSVAAFSALVAGPTLATMLLSGLWHGAGVTFIVWGFVHGVYLVINHAWRQWHPNWDKARYERVMQPLGLVLTFVAVVAAMVLFRAKTFAAAGHMLHGMIGLGGIGLPQVVLARIGSLGSWFAAQGGIADLSFGGDEFLRSTTWVGILLAAVFLLPNSLEVMRRFEPALNFHAGDAKLCAKPGVGGGARFVAGLSVGWAFFFGALLLAGELSLNRVSEFLYWQF